MASRRGGRYRMTPKRRAALRRAQLVSARNRKRAPNKGVANASHFKRNRGKYIGAAAGVSTALVLGGAVARHKYSGSELSISMGKGKHTGLTGRTNVGTESYGSRCDASSPTAPAVTHRNLYAAASVRNVFGVSVAYKHRELNRRNYRAVTGAKVRKSAVTPVVSKPVDADQIPFYNQKTKTKGWPHVDAKTARKINEKLRDKGMLA